MPDTFMSRDVADQLTECHGGPITCCAFAPRLAFAVSGGWDGQILYWDLETGQASARWQASPKPISAITITPDGQKILAGDMEGYLSEWQAPTHHSIRRELVHTRPIAGVAVAAHGHAWATASWDGSLQLWTQHHEENSHRTLRGHEDGVTGCTFWPDGKKLLSWSNDGTLRLWEVARAYTMQVWSYPGARLIQAAIAPDARAIVAVNEAGPLVLWNLTVPDHPSFYWEPDEPIRGAFFSPDAMMLRVVTASCQLIQLTVPELQEVPGRHHLQLGIHTATISHAGECLGLGGEDGTLYLQTLDDWRKRPLFVTPTETIEERSLSGLFNRLMRHSQLKRILRCSCPRCGRLFEMDDATSVSSLTCGQCEAILWLTPFTMTG